MVELELECKEIWLLTSGCNYVRPNVAQQCLLEFRKVLKGFGSLRQILFRFVPKIAGENHVWKAECKQTRLVFLACLRSIRALCRVQAGRSSFGFQMRERLQMPVNTHVLVDGENCPCNFPYKCIVLVWCSQIPKRNFRNFEVETCSSGTN